MKHIDVLPTEKTKQVRKITCIYYLNVQYQVYHGGQLRVYFKNESIDIAPTCDKLVVFRSADVEHEVLPTFATRMALTVWYYGKNTPYVPKEKVLGSNLPPVISVPADYCLPIESLPPLNLCEDKIDSESTIFVSIPSYRDSECSHTLQNLFTTAQFPHRIRVGVVVQNCSALDDDVLHHVDACWHIYIRPLDIDYRDAQGPMYARYLAQKLYHDEEYYLQIDSHMR